MMAKSSEDDFSSEKRSRNAESRTVPNKRHGEDCTYSSDLSVEWKRCCDNAVFPSSSPTSPAVAVSRPFPQGRFQDETSPETFYGEDDVHDEHRTPPLMPVINLLRLPPPQQQACPPTAAQSQEKTIFAKPPKPSPSGDPWYDNAIRLRDSIRDMSLVLHRRARDYADCDFSSHGWQWDDETEPTHDHSPKERSRCARDKNENVIHFHRQKMTEAEKALLETTIMSFMASTANQIEMLRKELPSDDDSHNDDDVTRHKRSIVAILLFRLRHDVALVMEEAQVVRSREANLMRRRPLSSVALRNIDTNDGNDYESAEKAGIIAAALESTDVFTDKEMEEDEDFDAAYSELQLISPPSEGKAKVRGGVGQEVDALDDAKRAGGGSRVSFNPQVHRVRHNQNYNDHQKHKEDEWSWKEQEFQHPSNDTAHYEPHEMTTREAGTADLDDLHRENILLQEQYHDGELDNVQRIETTMVTITKLLGQFSDLITDQQENVLLVHENTRSTEKNLLSGQDKLVDATERKKRSGHWMAKFILGLAFLLWFLNWITP